MEIGNSITAIEEGHSMSEVILNSLYSPIGMFFDSTWYPKHLKQRFLKGKLLLMLYTVVIVICVICIFYH